MDNMRFYEYVLSLLVEAGHVITSVPVYANHTSGETLYIDSSKDVMVSSFERELLTLIDNVSLLVDIRWAGILDELDENVQIFSITVDFPERVRSQNVAEIHRLLQRYWNCTHSIVFFKNRESYIISFADNDCSHILSDWWDIETNYYDVVERIGVENIFLETCKDYFFDFLFAVAREYYIYPISFEEAAYGLMPIDYISKSLSSDLPIPKEDVKKMIESNLATFESLYGDDYVESIYTGMDELVKYHNISDEIDRISFELELDEDENSDQFDYEDDEFIEDDEADTFDDYDEDVDPAIFDDPVLMVKWLEKKQRERLEAEHREQEHLEAKHREQEGLEVKRQQLLTLLNAIYADALYQEQKCLEAEQLEKIQLRCERLHLIAVLKQVLICKERHERLEIARREQERMEVERRKRERLEAERREKECIVAERQILFSQLEKDHLKKLKNLESQYHYEKQSLSDELSQIENLLRKKELRLSKLSFLQFMEKRTLNTDLDELKKKKQKLILLIQEKETEYIEQCDKERVDYNLLLAEKGL